MKNCIITLFCLFFFGTIASAGEARYGAYPITEDNFLYLSGHKTADDLAALQELGITHVINVTKDNPPKADVVAALDVTYLPLEDDLKQRVEPHFSHLMKVMEQAREKGGRVLVHCSAGQSRSASFVLYYLMRSEKMTLAKAFTFLKSKKADVNPNHSFIEQLAQDEEARTGGKRSVNVKQYIIAQVASVYAWIPRDVIVQALEDHHYNVSAAADSLLDW